MNIEGSTMLLLVKLSVDTIYRISSVNSFVREIICKKIIWNKLIERDIGIIPKFNIDPKLYYLRSTSFPIAGSIWKSRNGDRFILDTGSTKIINIVDSDKFVFRDGTLHWGDNKRLIIHKESIKQGFFYDGVYLLLTYSGKIYNLLGDRVMLQLKDINISKIVVGHLGRSLWINSKDGRVYNYSYLFPDQLATFDLPEKIIDIAVATATSENGNYYELNILRSSSGFKMKYTLFSEPVNNNLGVTFYPRGMVNDNGQIVGTIRHYLGSTEIIPHLLTALQDIDPFVNIVQICDKADFRLPQIIRTVN